jgi:hypothetical protein
VDTYSDVMETGRLVTVSRRIGNSGAALCFMEGAFVHDDKLGAKQRISPKICKTYLFRKTNIPG